MPNVLVRDLPEDVHAALQRQAAQHHQSLQQYLSGELRDLATRRPLSDVLDDIESRRGGNVSFNDAAADLATERASR